MDRGAPSSRGLNRPQLRTYSKRTTPRDDSEPPAKKQKTSNNARSTTAASGPKLTSENTPSSCATGLKARQPDLPAPRPSEPPKKGTIMSYFKVTSPSSGAATPCEASSDALRPPSTTATPPSSPPPLLHARKKRRRLTTKPAYQTPTTTTEDDLEDEQQERELSGPAAKEGAPSEQQQQQKSRTVALDEVSVQKLNRQDSKSEESRSEEAGKRGIMAANPKKKKRMSSKPTPAATVQTTLVLSLNETGFIECQECNMLYNSLHEKDVKLHARRHAAVLRKAAKMGPKGEEGRT